MRTFNFLDGVIDIPSEIEGRVTVARYDTTPSLLSLVPALLRSWIVDRDDALFRAISARFSSFISLTSLSSDSYAHLQDHWNSNYCPFLNRYFRWLRSRLSFVETRISPCCDDDCQGSVFTTQMPSFDVMFFLPDRANATVLLYAFDTKTREYFVVTTTRNSAISIYRVLPEQMLKHVVMHPRTSILEKTLPDCKSFFLEVLEQDVSLPWSVILRNICDKAYAFLRVLSSKQDTTLLHQLPAPAVEQIVEALRY